MEVSSFVSPRAVPQLADAEDVFAALTPREGVTLGALVPNERGLQRALATSAGEIALFTGATDAFTTHNIHLTVEESLERFAPLAGAARAAGKRVRGYVSVAFGCPYQGAVAPSAVHDVARRLFDLGVDEVSLGDTIGVATPNQVPQVAGPLLEEFGPQRVALHLHDTRGTALANAFAGLLLGVDHLRLLGGGPGGLPLRPRRRRQPGHRGPPLFAAGDGDRDGGRPGRRRPRLSRPQRRAGAIPAQSLPRSQPPPFRNSPEMC